MSSIISSHQSYHHKSITLNPPVKGHILRLPNKTIINTIVYILSQKFMRCGLVSFHSLLIPKATATLYSLSYGHVFSFTFIYKVNCLRTTKRRENCVHATLIKAAPSHLLILSFYSMKFLQKVSKL